MRAPRLVGRSALGQLGSGEPFRLPLPAGPESICFIISSQRASCASFAAEALAVACCAAVRARWMTSQSGPASACAVATPREARTIVLRVECMMIFPRIRFGAAARGAAPHAQSVQRKSCAWPNWATRGDRSDSQAGCREIDRPRRGVRSVSRPQGPYGVRRRWEDVPKLSRGRQGTEIGRVTVAVGPVPTVLLMVRAQGRLRVVHLQATCQGGHRRRCHCPLGLLRA